MCQKENQYKLPMYFPSTRKGFGALLLMTRILGLVRPEDQSASKKPVLLHLPGPQLRKGIANPARANGSSEPSRIEG